MKEKDKMTCKVCMIFQLYKEATLAINNTPLQILATYMAISINPPLTITRIFHDEKDLNTIYD